MSKAGRICAACCGVEVRNVAAIRRLEGHLNWMGNARLCSIEPRRAPNLPVPRLAVGDARWRR